MTPEAMALDVRRTVALWVTEGLTISQMCVALRCKPPRPGADALQYVVMRATALWLNEMAQEAA